MAPPLPIGGIPIRGGGLFITRPPNKSRLELGPLVDVEAAPNKSIEEGGLVAVGGGVGGAGRRLDEEGVVGFDPDPNAEEKSANSSPPLFPVPMAVVIMLLAALLFETLLVFPLVPNADSKSPKSPLGLLLAFIVSPVPRGLKSSSSS